MAGSFLDELDIQVEATGTMVVLRKELRYKSSDNRTYTIPSGFRCDLASVPGWLRSLAPPWQQSARAGVLHDCGYRWFEVWNAEKKVVDSLFHEALRADKTGRFRARAMYFAVKFFGGITWKNWRKTPESEKGVKPVKVV